MIRLRIGDRSCHGVIGPGRYLWMRSRGHGVRADRRQAPIGAAVAPFGRRSGASPVRPLGATADGLNSSVFEYAAMSCIWRPPAIVQILAADGPVDQDFVPGDVPALGASVRCLRVSVIMFGEDGERLNSRQRRKARNRASAP